MAMVLCPSRRSGQDGAPHRKIGATVDHRRFGKGWQEDNQGVRGGKQE
ncbi:hypothetical protein [Novosphingobium pokkalii]|nr:hypothetical protein [Novosphingobium pokkalii]